MLKKIIRLKKVKEKELIKLLAKMYKYKSMLSYCLKCRKNIENINPKISGTSTGKTIISYCVICARKKSRFTNKARSKWVIE